MDIAAMSVSMSNAQLQYAASISVLKNVIDFEETVTAILTDTLASLPVGSGTESIDVYV